MLQWQKSCSEKVWGQLPVRLVEGEGRGAGDAGACVAGDVCVCRCLQASADAHLHADFGMSAPIGSCTQCKLRPQIALHVLVCEQSCRMHWMHVLHGSSSFTGVTGARVLRHSFRAKHDVPWWASACNGATLRASKLCPHLFASRSLYWRCEQTIAAQKGKNWYATQSVGGRCSFLQ